MPNLLLGTLVCSGDKTNPSSGDVLADSTPLESGGTTQGSYLIECVLASSLSTRFEIGEYDGNNVAVNVFKINVVGGATGIIPLLQFPILNGHKFQIRAVNNLVGIVNVAFTMRLILTD